ncbi:amino acid adenylation domain-containing protein [Mycobacterium sp.]|uniref:amino acid adenylation domain-containing protein n=1 Tax=Mycobacterium sp. TaxID=1785 RepID=UPI003BA9FB19
MVVTSVRPEIEDVLALSPLQEGLFALYRLAEDSIDLYSMQFVIDIDGPVDIELLRRSAEAMLVRHPNLRAAFWDRDVPKPVQIVPVEAELPWEERTASPAEFESIARSERYRPFDLSRGPALRVVLLTVPGEGRRRMIVTAHHILMDGWALAVFFTEMLTVYRAGGSLTGLPAPRPYRDYIGWLAQQDRGAAIVKWAEYLHGLSGPLVVADSPVGAGDGVPEKTKLLLAEQDTTRLRRWAGRNGLTLNTAVLFAWAVVLGRITDRRDVVFGTIVSGRPEHLPGVETMVGLFINAIPVVHQLSRSASVVEQCVRLQRESSAMRDIGYLSLSEIQRDSGRGALFDTLFVFENAPIEDAIRPVTEPDGTRFCPVEMESLTHYPLTVTSHMAGDALVVLVEAIHEALPHLRPAELGERLLAVLRQLPEIGDGTPDALDILTPAERAEFAALANRSLLGPGSTVWSTFERQARATPDAIALSTTDGECCTYAELREHACRLAQELAELGVGPEVVVALVMPRSVRSIVAVLAVLAAGGAYLPVDVTLPRSRIESIVRQASPTIALTEVGYAELVAVGLPVLVLDDPSVSVRISRRDAYAPVVQRHAEHAAYVIFTSGSTGEPKGVIGTNSALLSYFADHRERVYRPATTRLGRPLRIAHAWSMSFDASWQPMVGLLDGHMVHLFNAEEMRDADLLVNGMAGHQVDMIDTTPSMFAQLSAAGLLDESLSVLALGGEAIDTVLWQQLRELSPMQVYNCYGPTEATVEAVVASVHEYQTPTIGTANTGTAGYVLDSTLRIVPNGVVGELYLSGAQLARGYAARSAMTACRFVADPLRPGHRMYRTGDLARRLPHGGFAYLGRGDQQVKIRGYRVEIGEVEAVLRDQAMVHDAAVSVVRRAGGPCLVGFVVWQGTAQEEPAGLRAALTARLPVYMVPARIVSLPQLPVNANGKLDSRTLDGLAEQALCGSTDEAVLESAATDTERLLCEIFAEQFNGATPHIDDDFFSLGIDSIVAISLVHKLRHRGISVNPRMVLSSTTIRQLAAAIDTPVAAEAASADVEHGPVRPLPIVSWLLEHGNFRRFTNNVLLRLPFDVDRSSIELMLQLLLDGHDALRLILVETPEGPRLATREPGVVRAADLLARVESMGSSKEEIGSVIAESARRITDEIDPYLGAMVRAVWISAESEQVLLLSVHHLAVDAVSWHIILGDIADAWRSVKSGVAPKTLPELTSYRDWSALMWQRAATPEVRAQREYWIEQIRDFDPALGARHPDPTRDSWSSLQATPVATSTAVTERVLATLTREGGVRDFLLAAITMTVAGWRRVHNQDPAVGTLIALESHGRSNAIENTDTSNTVGWFNSIFPIRLGVGMAACDLEQAESDSKAARRLFDSVTTDLSAVPYEGLDYGLLRYVDPVPELQEAVEPQVMFSYLGRLDLGGITDQPWSVLFEQYIEDLPVAPEPDLPLRFALHVGAAVRSTPDGSQLIANWLWSDGLFTHDDIDRMTHLWQRSVAVMAAALDPDMAVESGRRTGLRPSF